MTIIERVFGRKGGRWSAFFLLAPLACLAGAFLISRYDAHARLGLSIGREEAIANARAFARTKGVDTSGWEPYAVYQPEPPWRRYLAAHRDPSLERLRNQVPDIVARVILLAPGEDRETFEVRLGRDGTPAGFQRVLPKQASEPPANEASELALARRALAVQVGDAEAAGYQLAASGVEAELPARPRVYRWRKAVHGHPHLTLETAIALQGRDVVRSTTTAVVAPAFRNRHPHLRPYSMVIKGLLLGAVILGVFVYVLVRLILRAREKEAPWKRVFLLGALFAAGVCLNMFLADIAMFPADMIGHEGHAHAAPGAVQVVVGAIGGALSMGLMLGVAWGAAEGDVREMFPDKLVSFDALLGGAWRSSAMWRSVATGLAFGCYAVLASGLHQLLTAQLPSGYQMVQPEFTANFAARYLLPLTMSLIVTATAIIVVGILVPISLGRRRVSAERMPWFVFALLFAFVALGNSATYEPLLSGLLAAAIGAAFIVLPFAKADLLASIGSTIVLSGVGFAVYVGSQPAPSLRNSGVAIAALLILLAVTATIGAWRGGHVALDEMRPEYARNITQRVALETEIDAARQAQLRIMPRRIPEVGGLEIAAECRPARRLSGDYFDFFQTGPRNVSVVVAAGERLRLSSALAATLAKGMLLSYSRRGLRPAETLEHVKRHVDAIFGEQLPLSLLYASFDTEKGQLEYASLGTSVALLFLRPGDSPQWLRALTAVDGGVAASRANLRAGDRCLVVTRGLLRASNQADVEIGGDELSRIVATSVGGGAADVLREIYTGVTAHTRGTDPEDDWTAVSIAVTSVDSSVAAEEVLA